MVLASGPHTVLRAAAAARRCHRRSSAMQHMCLSPAAARMCIEGRGPLRYGACNKQQTVYLRTLTPVPPRKVNDRRISSAAINWHGGVECPLLYSTLRAYQSPVTSFLLRSIRRESLVSLHKALIANPSVVVETAVNVEAADAT